MGLQARNMSVTIVCGYAACFACPSVKLVCNTLPQHRIANLFKACDIRACNEVAFHTISSGCIFTGLVDIDHNAVQLFVNLLKGS